MFARQKLQVLFAGLTILAASLTGMAATNYYVATNGPGGAFTNWATAASNIQDAIDRTIDGDTVWVSNGVYNTGGRTNYPPGYAGAALTNRIVITKAITVRSANNDPTNTIIMGTKDPSTPEGTNGPAAVRCVYMYSGVTLIGFMLTNGATLATGTFGTIGGGVMGDYWSSSMTLSNCIITGNMSAGGGGGTVYLSALNNCQLIGNWTGPGSVSGGGASGGTLNNCTVIGNRTSGNGGGTASCTLNNCVLTGNSGGGSGGGASGGSLFNCTLTSNTADYGGGAYNCTRLTNCTLIGNSATRSTYAEGGGASGCNLYNCTLVSNSLPNPYGKGGGASGGSLVNCLVMNNSATNDSCDGGGVNNAACTNCLIVGNYAKHDGGGASGGSLINCTVVNNAAGGGGGGVYNGQMWNSIIYFNTAGWGSTYNNWYKDSSIAFTNCCTMPTNSAGWAVGNITNNPMLADTNSGNYRLTSASPCINAGTNEGWMNGAVDLDGHHRIDIFSGMVDMGCYEFLPAGSMYQFGF